MLVRSHSLKYVVESYEHRLFLLIKSAYSARVAGFFHELVGLCPSCFRSLPQSGINSTETEEKVVPITSLRFCMPLEALM